MNAVLIMLMAAVAAVLLLGLVSLWRGGDYGRRNSNRLMWWRVTLQAVAVILVGIMLFLSGRS